jgi:hypothetical protein
MSLLTDEQIEYFKQVAADKTSQEKYPDDWDAGEISGYNYDDAYWNGGVDADIVNARFILELFGIKY